MPEVAAAALIVGTGIRAIGAYEGAQSEAASASYQAAVAKNNATVASQNARYAMAAGQAKAGDEAIREREALGRVVGGLAAGGVDVNSGSAVDARVTQREVGQLNTERVINNAALTAYGYRAQEQNFTDQAALYRGQASAASSSALPMALGTLFTGLGAAGGIASGALGSGLFGSASGVTETVSGGGGYLYGPSDAYGIPPT